MMADKESPKKRRPGCFRLLVTSAVLLTLCIIWALFMAGDFRAFEVIGDSMLNTFSRGDRVIAQQAAVATLKRGDIVVVDLPGDEEGNEIIKRLVGFPGETVALHNGIFTVNAVPETFPEAGVPFPPTYSFSPIELGPDQYFVLGDNRPISYDSEDFGPLPSEAIWGVVLFRYKPWEKRGKLR